MKRATIRTPMNSKRTAETNTHTPMRRCIGCMESKPKETLLRFVAGDGTVAPDPEAVLPGRGFYLDRSEECFRKALKRKAFQRVLKRDFPAEESEALLERIRPLF